LIERQEERKETMKLPISLFVTLLAAPTTGETIRGLGIGFEPTDAPVAAPTDAPVAAPSDAPIAEPTTEAPVAEPTTDAPVEPEPTDAPIEPEPEPTDAPVEPEPEPEPGVALVDVEIVFDGFAPEIGWFIADDNGTVVTDVPIGTYPPLTTSATEPVELMVGMNYTFTIVDLFGDGLSNPEDGSYTVTQGDIVLVSGGGNFGKNETTEFTTEY
jgi:hypothetical protein